MRTALAFALLLWGLVGARPPDVDALTEGLDLDPPAVPTPAPTPDTPPAHLFNAPIPFPDLEIPEALHASTGWVRLVLPAGSYLVAPNPERVDTASLRMRDAVETLGLSPAFPYKAVLHADGKFSLAVRLAETTDQPLPAGVDLSPLPEMSLIGRITDIQVLEKSHPLVLRAFQKLQAAVKENGGSLDTREMIFLPLEPGRVFFGMKLLEPLRSLRPNPDPNDP